MSTPGTSIGASTSSNDVNPDPNIQNQHRIRPNLSNRRWSQANSFFPPLQLPPRCRGQSQPTKSPTKYLQQTSGLPWSPIGYKHLTCHTPRFLPTFTNRRRGPTNCPRPLPQIPEILSTNTRDFELGDVTPPKPSEILVTGGPKTRSSEALFVCMTKRLFLVFCGRVACALI